MTTVRTLSSNTIRVKIYDQFIVALVDTGCGTSVLSKQLANKLSLPINPLSVGDNQILIAADGNPIHVIGKTSIPIKIGGLSMAYEFMVVNELTQTLILGIDFLKSTKAVINCDDKTASFYDDLVRVQIMNHDRHVVACVTHTFFIQPRTESIIPVTLSRNIGQQSVLLEPLPMRDKQKFLVAKSLITPKHLETFCKVLNPTNRILKLRQGLPLAFVQDIEINSITPID